MNPKVTVLMAVYNGEKYLKEAIESILNQTFTDFEFLIINDGSTDKSLEIINSYQNNRIVIVENEENIGLSASLNRGIAIAKGEYIARMDADDISLPKRLEKQVLFMDQNPETGLCGSWVRFFGEMNMVAKYAYSHKEIVSNMFTSSPVAHPSVIFRKELFNRLNLRYNPEFKIAQDYELWIKATQKIVFANIQEVLLNYRINPNQLTGINATLDEENLKIWHLQLNNLGLDFSDDDLHFHYLLMSEKFTINDSKEFLIKSVEWFDKIIEANNKKQIYDKKTLINIFKEKWYKAFKNIFKADKKFNILDILDIFIYPRKFKYLSFKNKLRFLYRFIKDRHGGCFRF